MGGDLKCVRDIIEQAQNHPESISSLNSPLKPVQIELHVDSATVSLRGNQESQSSLDGPGISVQTLDKGIDSSWSPPDIFSEFLNYKDKDGYTPVHAAAQHLHINVIEYLRLKGADIHKLDKMGRTPLIWSCYKNDLIATRWFLSKQADI
jgi:ankyrin repeat protein